MNMRIPPQPVRTVNDSITLGDYAAAQSAIPRSRDEFLRLCNTVYNLKVHRDFPVQLFLELTNVCNFACPMCSQKHQTRAQGFMAARQAELLIDECADRGLYWLGLFMNGESLLHRDLIPLIRHAKQRGIPVVNLTTNGYLINEAVARELIAAGLDTLVFSFGGKDKSDYYRMYGRKENDGSEYARVAENIALLHRLRAAGGGCKPFIRINAKFMPGTSPEEISAFKENYGRYADFIDIGQPHNYGAGNDVTGRGRHWGDRFRIPCRKVWRHVVVLWNGDVSLCCLDQDGATVFGNAFTAGLQAVWDQPRRRELENHHILGTLENIPFCQQCYDGWDQ